MNAIEVNGLRKEFKLIQAGPVYRGHSATFLHAIIK